MRPFDYAYKFDRSDAAEAAIDQMHIYRGDETVEALADLLKSYVEQRQQQQQQQQQDQTTREEFEKNSSLQKRESMFNLD